MSEIATLKLSEDIRDRYVSMTESIDKCVFIDTNVDNFLRISLGKYYMGETTLEEAVEEAEKKIMLYLNE